MYVDVQSPNELEAIFYDMPYSSPIAFGMNTFQGMKLLMQKLFALLLTSVLDDVIFEKLVIENNV